MRFESVKTGLAKATPFDGAGLLGHLARLSDDNPLIKHYVLRSTYHLVSLLRVSGDALLVALQHVVGPDTLW